MDTMKDTRVLNTGQQTALTYRRVVIERHGGPEVLRVIRDAVPEPAPAEVRVKILAAGVSFPDVEIRAGTYPGAPPPPLTPGYELVGVVDKLGPGAGSAALRLGQMVAAMTVVGGYAEYICLPESELVPAPAGVDPTVAVCLVFNYLVAYQLLHRAARVRAGERVLIHGAAGGVGSAALQLGKLVGLELFGTASATDLELVAQLGATPIDYRREDVVSRIRALTGGEGVDVVLDGIGGMTSLGSYRALRRSGRLVMYGHFATLVRGRRRLRSLALFYLTSGLPILAGLLPGGKRVRTYQCAKLKQRHPEWFRQDVTALFDLLQKGKIAPIVAARLPLEEARRAHELLGRGGVRGKIVLLCDAPRIALADDTSDVTKEEHGSVDPDMRNVRDVRETQPAGPQDQEGLLQRVGGAAFGLWVIKHIFSPLDRRLYRWTGGRGVTLGRPMAPRLLLTTIGRRTGRARTVPIFYLRDGDRLIICNVSPGFERPNPWQLNLRANPMAQVQVGAEAARYRAREATDEEVARYWPQLIRIWPAYQSLYEQGGQRSIFVLEPDRGVIPPAGLDSHPLAGSAQGGKTDGDLREVQR